MAVPRSLVKPQAMLLLVPLSGVLVLVLLLSAPRCLWEGSFSGRPWWRVFPTLTQHPLLRNNYLPVYVPAPF